MTSDKPKMTDAEFIQFCADEIRAAKARPDFAERQTAVLARIDAGEIMAPDDIAQALDCPLWMVELDWMRAKREIVGHLVQHDEGAPN